MKFLLSKRNLLIITIIIAFVFMAGCSNETSTSADLESQDNNTQANNDSNSGNKIPQLELIQKIDLGAVKEENIPDVLSTERLSVDIVSTSPIVSPDGKNVLTLEEDGMKWIETKTGKTIWGKSTYGGISEYLVTDDKIFMAEKYASKKSKDEGNIICLDAKTGEELWKYDISQDLAKVANQYKPADASWSIYCSIDLIADDEKVYAIAYASWKNKDKSKDKAEVLEAIDMSGNKLWQTNNHGYPGIATMSDMALVDDVVVMGNYSYGDEIAGPAGAHAYNINTGKLAWKYDLPNDPKMAYSKKTNTTVGVVGDKIVLMANFGKTIILDSAGNKINEFNMYEPESYKDVLLVATFASSNTVYGENIFAVAPNKTYMQGSSKSSDAPAQHSDVGMLKVFDLEGNLKLKFRLGGAVSSMYIKGDKLILSTFANATTKNYDDCGVYVFDVSQLDSETEVDLEDKSSLDKFIGYYQTNGSIIYDSLAVSEDGNIIAAATSPIKVDVEKHGEHSLYLLEIK